MVEIDDVLVNVNFISTFLKWESGKLQAMAFCVSIIDHSSASMVKLDQKKRISISRLDKIFKVLSFLYTITSLTGPFLVRSKSDLWSLSISVSWDRSSLRWHANPAILVRKEISALRCIQMAFMPSRKYESIHISLSVKWNLLLI